MKIFIQTSLLLSFIVSMQAQTFQEISCGAGYNQQSYVSLATDEQTLVDNDTWDLAFTAFGVQDAGIFINESSGSINGQNIPVVEVYYTTISNFDVDFNVESLKDNLIFNDEISYNYGAFNSTRDTLNPFDFGWGKYEPSMHGVVGNEVFIVKLRDGSFKKVLIESLIGTDYTLKYADLNGDNLVIKKLNKTTDSNGKGFIFYNLSTHSTVDILPSYDYDFMYGRYISIAKDPNGTIVQQYNVTGILTGPQVSSVMADGVDVDNVQFADYKDQMSDRLDVIGYDWKTFTNAGWILDEDRVYFIKSKNNTIWKLQFIDFEGSSTGTTVLTKEVVGQQTATNDANIASLVYPNPSADIVYVITDQEITQFQCFDTNGRSIPITFNKASDASLYVYTLDIRNMQSGLYILQGFGQNQKTLTTKFIKSK
ncbi:MAG: HmuY family protein [Saprospiraceae bacterium]